MFSMIKQAVYLCFLGILGMASCSSEANPKSVSIDLNASEHTIELERYIKETVLIPLETKTGAMLGPSSMNHFKEYDGRFYFLNKEDHTICVFDESGRHQESIKKYGRGPGEYIMESDMLINPILGTIDILNQRGQIYSYSIDDKQHALRRFIDVSSTVVSAEKFTILPSGDEYLLYCPASAYSLYYVNNNEITPDVRHFNYKINPVVVRSPYHTSGNPFVELNGKLVYMDGTDGTIYDIDEKKMKLNAILKWDFGKYNFSLDKLPQTKDPALRFQGMKELSKQMVGPFSHLSVTSSDMFISFYWKSTWHTLVYNLKSSSAFYGNTTAKGELFAMGLVNGGNSYSVADPSFLSRVVNPDILFEDSHEVLDTILSSSNYVIIKNRLALNEE